MSPSRVLARAAAVSALLVALHPESALANDFLLPEPTLRSLTATPELQPVPNGSFALTLNNGCTATRAPSVCVPPPHLLAQMAQKHVATRLANLDPLSPLQQTELNANEGWLVSAGRLGSLVAGAWAAALAHEVGHAFMAWGYGYDFVWPTNRYGSEFLLPEWSIEQQDISETNRRNISLGGFVFSAAISETMLALDTFPKSDAFVGGFVLYDLVNAVFYVGRDIYAVSTYNKSNGDIEDIDKGGFPREAMYIVLLVRSALVLARVLEDPEFLKLYYWWDSSRPP